MVNHFATEERTDPIRQYMFLYETRISLGKIYNRYHESRPVCYLICFLFSLSALTSWITRLFSWGTCTGESAEKQEKLEERRKQNKMSAETWNMILQRQCNVFSIHKTQTDIFLETCTSIEW